MSFDFEKYIRDTDLVNAGIDFDSLPKGNLISWEHFIRNEYWEAEHRRGRRVMTYGMQNHNPLALKNAVRIMQTQADHLPSPSPLLFKNLGNAYNMLSAFEPQARTGMVTAWKKYLDYRVDDPDNEVIQKAIR